MAADRENRHPGGCAPPTPQICFLSIWGDEVKYWYLCQGGTPMPRIRLVVEDDHGQPLAATAERVYVLEGPCDTLNDIDEAVETFKNTALPEVEKFLLEKAQQQFVTTPKRG